MEMRKDDNPTPREALWILEELWDNIKEAQLTWEPQKIWEYKYKNILITIEK